jgi:hypothetical protein
MRRFSQKTAAKQPDFVCWCAAQQDIWAILPHTCFTVNTHILRSRAGKGWKGIMGRESAKSF